MTGLRSRHSVAILLACLVLAGLLLACGAAGTLPIAQGPRWACPSPVPQPWGADGPIKGYRPVGTPDPTSGVRDMEPIYYELWEQEYGTGGTLLAGQSPVSAPPYPSPTPYGHAGMAYSFGQRVELAPLHLRVAAHANGPAGPGEQRYLVELDWHNPTGRALPVSYEAQVWLRTVMRPDGTRLTGDGWGVSRTEAARLGLAIPATIAPGESRIVLPVLAPPGQPTTVEVRLPIQLDTQVSDLYPPAVLGTPTPNAELRDPRTRWLTVQWVAAAPVGPPCDNPGALTDWDAGNDRKAIPRDAAVHVRAPAGAPRVVQLALAQVGKRYVWGAAGPDSFDCSGLMFWSYAQIGIGIPRTTATQWPELARISLGEAQPGDLVYLDTREQFGGTPGQVTHVGMLADVDQDGRWDLIHAASPRLGVRVDYDVFASAYYAPRLFGEGRTAR